MSEPNESVQGIAYSHTSMVLTECLYVEVDHIQWTDVDALVPFIGALVGVVMTTGTVYVLAKQNDTAILKASTRELTYMILAGIMLAYV